eukprot:scaffold4886_cov123-Isochrysis_galbana.AAC.22
MTPLTDRVFVRGLGWVAARTRPSGNGPTSVAGAARRLIRDAPRRSVSHRPMWHWRGGDE